MSSSRSTRVLYLDTHLGTALLYSCANTAAGHRSSGTLLSRAPDTLLPTGYIEKVMAVFAHNSLYDVLPLHPVNQTEAACAAGDGTERQRPPPANAPNGRRLPEMPKVLQSLDKSIDRDNQSPACNCTCPRSEL